MTIRGVGVDLVDVQRIDAAMQRFGDRFARKILAEPEYRPQLSGRQLSAYVARQFAAKEAVSKCLGTGMRQGVHFRNIHILRDDLGAPLVELESGASAVATAKGISTIHISLSDERNYAMAYALAI